MGLRPVAVIVGCSLLAATGSVAAPVHSHYAAAKRTDPVVKGGTDAQRRLLRTLLAGIASPRIASIRVGKPNKGYEPRDSVWLHFKVPDGDGLVLSRSVWQTSVISGLFAETSRARRLPSVTGRSVTLILRNGHDYYRNGGIFHLARDVTAARESHLRGLIEKAARGTPLIIQRIRIDRPLGRPAVTISALTFQPRTVARERYALVARLTEPITNPENGPPVAEGTFVEVRDPRGVWVSGSGFATRMQAGTGAANPRFLHGG